MTPTNYRLLSLDLDGTLFDSGKKVRPRTREAILEAARTGVLTVVNSGRALFEVIELGNGLHTSGYAIASNGAVVRNLATGKDLVSRPFGRNQLALIRELIEANGLSATFFSSDMIFTRGKKLPPVYRGFFPGKKTGRMKDRVARDAQIDGDEIQKCNLFSLSPEQKKTVFSSLREAGEYELVFTGKSCAEITPRGVTKATGLQALANETGIAANEIIAIGDSENDVDMIRFAGLGIAMGNSSAALLNSAAHVTGSNDADGIADAIQRFLVTAR
jgi:Cof subfamily protein (haloacid dehalogenase superfamily)